MQTTGNTILITGGTSGIGFAFAEEFLKLGNKVIICGRRNDRLKEIKNKFPEIEIFQCDVSDALQRERLKERIAKNFPDLNILMNNAGVQLHSPVIDNIDLQKIYSEIETNFIAPIHLASLFVPLLKSKNNSAVINITSGLAFCPLSFMPVYCATKAAMHSMTLSLRHQLKDTSIKVFEIAPPAVDTELGHDRREDKTQSHGGIPVSEFLTEAMEGIKNDNFETCVGMAKGLREKREGAFEFMNK